jgi:hypothetical protein
VAGDAPDGSSAPRGTRYLLTLDEARSTGAHAIYRGTAEREGQPRAIEVLVERELTRGVAVDPTDAEAVQLAEKAAALVRAVARTPLLEGRRPPRRIHRWRA